MVDFLLERPRNRGWRKYRAHLILGATVVAVVFAVAAIVPLGLYVMSRNDDAPAAGAQESPAPAAGSVNDRISNVLASFKGVAGVAARNLATGEEIAINADAPFPTASTIKTAVMIEAYQASADGRLRLDDEVVLRAEDKVGGAGVLGRMHDGLRLTIAELIDLMIVLSDNTATNLLIDRLGTARIDARLAGYGFRRTHLFRPTFRDGRADLLPDLEREFGLGMTTPREMAGLMALIAEGAAVSPEASAAMLNTLRRQQDRAMIPRLLPPDRGLQIGNKTGTDEEKHPGPDGVRRHVRADAAIVTGPDATYVIAIYARQVDDPRSGVENEAVVTGARISRMIYDHFSRR